MRRHNSALEEAGRIKSQWQIISSLHYLGSDCTLTKEIVKHTLTRAASIYISANTVRCVWLLLRMRLQGSRVRPNFSRVRLTKIPGRTGASSHSRKEKKVSATQKLCGSTKDTPVRLIPWSKPIRDSEGRTPPLIGRGPDIPVCVCARWQMHHVCCCSQTERKRWVVEMRAVLPT